MAAAPWYHGSDCVADAPVDSSFRVCSSLRSDDPSIQRGSFVCGGREPGSITPGWIDRSIDMLWASVGPLRPSPTPGWVRVCRAAPSQRGRSPGRARASSGVASDFNGTRCDYIRGVCRPTEGPATRHVRGLTDRDDRSSRLDGTHNRKPNELMQSMKESNIYETSKQTSNQVVRSGPRFNL